MPNEFDHIVVACADLEQGAAWVRSALGVDVVPGGRHAAMGTHNRLLRLGTRAYLEIIAIDPDAPPPGRPRWFNLDQPVARDRVAHAPFVTTWVIRSGAIATVVNRMPVLGEVLSLSRGPYRWRIAVPADGGLPFDGALPAVIEWDGNAHPADALPDVGCALLGVSVTHPRANELQALLGNLGVEPPIDVKSGRPAIDVRLRCPDGVRTIG